MKARVRVRRALLTWVIGLGIFRATLWAPEVCPELDRVTALEQATAAGEWLTANQLQDGRYLYGWNRRDGTPDAGYNEVRHAGVTLSLYQLAAAGELSVLAHADDGLQWMLDQLRPAGSDALALTIDKRQPKLGASSLLLVALIHRRKVTGEQRHDATMHALGRFLVGQQRSDGSMLDRFDDATGRPVPGATSIFATGEALWALALLHNLAPGNGFDHAAIRTLDYMATERDRIEGFFPQPWPDQWAAYALAEMAPWGLEEHHLDYAEALMARYAMIVRFDAQRGTSYGAITHGPVPRGAGNATWIEGLASLWRATLIEPRLGHHSDRMHELVACGVALLAERQVTSPGAPATEAGAWFYRDETRMDDQQHAASALLLASPALPG